MKLFYQKNSVFQTLFESLKKTFIQIAHWIEMYPLTNKDSLNNAKDKLIFLSEKFVLLFTKLQNFKAESQNILQIETTLQIESIILSTLKRIENLSQQPYYKHEIFSFLFLLQIAYKISSDRFKGNGGTSF